MRAACTRSADSGGRVGVSPSHFRAPPAISRALGVRDARGTCRIRPVRTCNARLGRADPSSSPAGEVYREWPTGFGGECFGRILDIELLIRMLFESCDHGSEAGMYAEALGLLEEACEGRRGPRLRSPCHRLDPIKASSRSGRTSHPHGRWVSARAAAEGGDLRAIAGR